ncbi:pseudaminic acid biosynthesis-associated methylase [Paenibacillus sp. YYML68]|uniref:pseudaminic acid biosynthesis-associated methylase n=1 Tax=Paenibacillus sp. YYML68 TaxID=2909250 RepID=UPI002490F26E|nr:pseudaminic acid biosynthesis-associated methylase [Paenibacillus sp. YYML68]
MKTNQMDFWNGQFGSEYTDRNTYSYEELDGFYKAQFGVTRTEMNQEFLGGLSLATTLEAGCNVGNQLRCLQAMGFNGLYGIELQQYAVEKSKQLSRGINIIQGSLFDIPFKDSYFDMVFTSGVLIHISPDDIYKAIDEMYRVSNRYIWGFEYYAEAGYQEVQYRGNEDKLWKTNFMQLFLDRYPNLQVVKEKIYKYVQSDLVDQMYLLEKK